jgi:hypothetical protein
MRFRARVPGLSLGKADLPVLAVALAAAAVFVLFAAKDGGFAPTVWLPGGVFIVLLLGLTLVLGATSVRRIELAVVASLAAFTAWSALSILWAGSRGDAWDGANRTLLYLCVFSLFVALPWRAATAAVFMSAFAVGVTTVAMVQFLRVAAAPVAHHDFFVSGRLAVPVSYSNADCALLLMAALPAIVLASRREAPILARGLLLAAGGSAIELAIACQSRTSLVALPLAVLFVAVLAPRRLRLLVVGLPVGVAVALASRPLLDVYDATILGPGRQALADARTALIASSCALFVVGCLIAVADRRVALPSRVVQAFGLLTAAAALCAVVAGAVALILAVPHPVRTLHDRWASFSHGTGYTDQRKSHLLSGGTNRYDIWRVALDEFEKAPVVGVGVDNFAVDYLRHRRSRETPLYPHSVLLRALSETGLVGAVLFAAVLAAAAAAARGLFRRGSRVRTPATAAAAVFVYWFVHGTADWLWEIPALGAPAFACLAITVRLGAGERLPGGRRVPAALVAAPVAALIASFGFPWIAAQETALASTHWPDDRALAFRRLDLAARLNPLSDLPPETKGLIAARSGDPAAARPALAEALDRNPANWFAHFELGVVNAQLHRYAEALASLDRAGALNPREPVIGAVRRRVVNRSPVPQSLVDKLLAQAG